MSKIALVNEDDWLEGLLAFPTANLRVAIASYLLSPHSRHFGLFSVPAPSQHLGVRRGFFIGFFYWVFLLGFLLSCFFIGVFAELFFWGEMGKQLS